MTTKAEKIEGCFIRLIFEEKIRHVKGHFGPINFYPDDKGADYMYIQTIHIYMLIVSILVILMKE